MDGKVIKAFPFAFDGINVQHLAVGQPFPPQGQTVADGAFNGLVDAGYIEAGKTETLPPEETLNRSIIEAMDRRLAAASDQDLEDIIARSGTPYSGNMVHARLVFAAKQQMLAEMEGADVIRGIDPNSGVTEQPLSAPGQPTPPSAAAAVDQQKAHEEVAEKAAGEAGENTASNQFGDPMPSRQPPKNEDLDGMKKDELEKLAADRGVNISAAKTKADIIDAINAGKSA
ncbi:hypothetical protein NKH14_17605 [Mesorhizobium sp. M1380]|uniref:hypothetical protein n=1 Tax=Mesorhizobium sp. M1380 TaxID=2957093 RepID=UPI00333E0BF3